MRANRRQILAGSAASLLFAKPADVMWFGRVSSTTPTGWSQMKIGAGGLIKRVVAANDGTLFCYVDTYGAYLWNGTQWVSIIPESSLTDLPSLHGGQDNVWLGVYGLDVAPSNSRRLYIVLQGWVWTSTNQGASWTRTTLSQDTATGSNGNGLTSTVIAVDPNNEDVCFYGSPTYGLYYTINGGSAWTNVSSSTIPRARANNSGAKPIYVAIDPSVTSSGRSQNIYVASYGNGVYKSTNGGSTWADIFAPASNILTLRCSSDGYLYALDDSFTSAMPVYIYNGSSWSTVNASPSDRTSGPIALAVDPSTAGRVYCFTNDGRFSASTNYGTTWSGIQYSWSFTATDIPWLAFCTTLGAAPSGFETLTAIFNPGNPNQLLVGSGVGVWTTSKNDTPHAVGVSYASQSLGIEQLVANEIICPPGQRPLVASWDRPIIQLAASGFPSNYFPAQTLNVISGWSVDYAKDGSGVIGAICEFPGFGDYSGYTSNYGSTWTTFNNGYNTNAYPDSQIAVSTFANMVVTTLDWSTTVGGVWYTTNAGSSWARARLPGVPTTQPSGWGGGGDYFNWRHVCADEVTTGTFYAYNDKVPGVYRSTDGGATWTRVYGRRLGLTNNGQIRAVPGNAGHLFHFQGWGPAPHPQSGFRLNRSIDGGAVWSTVSNMVEPRAMGFGAIKPGQSYPTIYVAGWGTGTDYVVGSLTRQWGVWRSVDNCATWQRMSDATFGAWPVGNLDNIRSLSGDSSTYAKVYVGFQGSGYAQGYFP